MKYREKKLRGIPRRMRSLRRWSLHFKDFFPSQAEIAGNSSYWNWKLPTHSAMVEGKNSTPQMKREIAQLLIDACGYLISNKPEWAIGYRVTCVICQPDMFGSEICIFLDEEYFRGKVAEGEFPVEGAESKVVVKAIQGHSLAQEWQLVLPAGVSERGSHVSFNGYDDGEDAFSGEYWMYGEVSDALEAKPSASAGA